jgi:hypothetical protein
MLKAYEESFGADTNIHSLDCSDGFIGINVCQNLSKLGQVLYLIPVIPATW